MNKIATDGMLTRAEIAAALGVPMGTIAAQLSKFNRFERSQGRPGIQPDEQAGSHEKHVYKAERLDEFRALLKFTTATRGPGRPRKDAK